MYRTVQFVQNVMLQWFQKKRCSCDMWCCAKKVLLNVLLLPDDFAYMMHHCYKILRYPGCAMPKATCFMEQP
jgi:hypothetical protein